ncbi:MAG: 3-deoxy-manno-octulosonate cytidylyltransferase [Planctomycetes bacterium]|nr:3-deoxy-manno-octulosonate cytidylyltransferase [Planctomycetota bacterium]
MNSTGDSPRALAIVPARLASVRLPRKMLLAETGLPLCVHTVRNLRRCAALERIVLAVDDEEVAAAARAHGVEAVLTRVEHPSGTDRAFEAASKVGGTFDVVVNVQGDEPELDPADLGRLVAAFSSPEVEAATLAASFVDPDEALASQVVKVVRDERGDALYFSRAPIPHRSTDPSRAYARADARPWAEVARRHVGVYAFRPAALERFVRSSPGTLERLENLEQLRWLEQGRRMRVVDAGRVPLGIDTRADYDAFVGRVRSEAAR